MNNYSALLVIRISFRYYPQLHIRLRNPRFGQIVYSGDAYTISDEAKGISLFFFFALFHLVAITKTLILEGYRITPIGALMSQLFCCSVLDHLGVA